MFTGRKNRDGEMEGVRTRRKSPMAKASSSARPRWYAAAFVPPPRHVSNASGIIERSRTMVDPPTSLKRKASSKLAIARSDRILLGETDGKVR